MPSLQTVVVSLVEGARRIAPYLLTELLLPGGTVLALLLFLARRRRAQLARAHGRSAHRPRCTRAEPAGTIQPARAA